MKIEWMRIEKGISESLDEVPKDAELISIDDQRVMNTCTSREGGCDGYLLEIDVTSCKCNKCGRIHNLMDELF